MRNPNCPNQVQWQIFEYMRQMGLTEQQTAQALGLSAATVHRQLVYMANKWPHIFAEVHNDPVHVRNFTDYPGLEKLL